MNNKRDAVVSALFEKKNKRKPKNSQELQDFIQSQGGDEFLKKVDEYIAKAEKDQAQQAQKAAHGAKLQYFRNLKNKCAEDEELVYYKKGGKVDCGCQKKQKGGDIPPKKQSAVDKFKAQRRTKEQQAKIDKQSQEDYENGTYGMSKEEIEQFNNPNKQKKTPVKKFKPVTPTSHEAGGKAMPKGPYVKGKVCPKCGKVHAAGMGCSIVDKFKKHQFGGNLKVKLMNEQWARRNNLPENLFSLTPEERNIAFEKWAKWKKQMANDKAIQDSIQKQRINYQNGIVPTNLKEEPTQIESNSNFFKTHR